MVVLALVLVAAVVGSTVLRSSSSEDDAFVADPDAVTVLHMNLCGALGCYGEAVGDRLEVADFASSAIVDVEADVVMLNEVCADQLDVVTDRLAPDWPMEAMFVETLATDNGCAGHGYGNAILHRGDRLGRRSFESCERADPPCLENPPSALSAEQRAMACADLRLPDHDGARLTACSTHLVPRGDSLLGDRTWDEWNDRQIESLTDLAATLDADGPVVIGADLNVGPRRVLDVLPDGWRVLDDELRPTRPVPDPRHKIDFVLLSPGVRAGPVGHVEVTRCPSSRHDGGWCTDHVPIVGNVTLD